jgi:ActR/RegA family two-component response regulator
MREPARILIVEDDPEWQSAIRQILKADGYAVDTVHTYREAVQAMKARPYQLAVIDIRLDALDPKDLRGMDLLDTVKQIGEEVYSIVVTGYGTVELASYAFREYGVLDFMDKAFFNPQRFRALVQKTLASLVYIVLQLNNQLSMRTMRIKEENVLTVSVQPNKPTEGTFGTILLPETQRYIELEIAIIAPNAEVLPGSRQYLKILPNGTSDPVSFKLVPEKRGRIEMIVEVYHRERWLRRLKLDISVLGAR